MKSTPIALAAVFVMMSSVVDAKRLPDTSNEKVFTTSTGSRVSFDQDMTRRFRSAAPGTTVLGAWNFDGGTGCNAQGWTTHDLTAQPGDFFHVDDFVGAGGDFGYLVPLAGSQSMWCGARANASDPILCSYQTLPGYGNNWDQAFCTKACLSVVGDVEVDFRITWDSEPGYDISTLEIDDACTNSWLVVHGGYGQWDGTRVDSAMTCVIGSALHTGSLKIRFHFRSDGAWSDADGLWNTDGALILDNLSVSDASGAVLGVETFEDEAVGDNDANDWESCTPPGFGDFAALYPGNTIVLEDECRFNLTCMWTFFTGSTETYACGGFPFQLAMPKGNADGQYLANEIWSPVLPYVGSGTDVRFVYDVYRDLPLNNLQFYEWHARSFVGGCPGQWEDDNLVFYGGSGQWATVDRPIGHVIDPAATEIQVALAAVDACGFWCGIYGTGACHSHAPIFDNFQVLRIDQTGPTWSVNDLYLFQDTFSGDGTISGTARADMANDILSGYSTNILPGDSCVVDVTDPEWGLAGPPLMYVAVWPQGQPGKGASGIESNDQTLIGGGPVTRFPVVDSLTHGGVKWYCVRMDTVYLNGYDRTNMYPDRYCGDLNDNVFTPCDTICFVFCAENNNGEKSYWTPFTGKTEDRGEALNAPAEFQVLPGGGWKNGGDILYVDGVNGSGAQPLFDTAFEMMGILDQVDRYDVRAPSSVQGNSPGGRVVNIQNQIIGCYRKIIWDAGSLRSGTLGDGTGSPSKANDAYLLDRFLNFLPNTGGVYFSGDHLAEEWDILGGLDALNLRNFITHNLTNGDHVAWGAELNPKITGVVGGCFDHITGPDQFVAYGECGNFPVPQPYYSNSPTGVNFDVLEPTGTAQSEMRYPGGASDGSAVISQTTLNQAGFNVGVILSGFSFQSIRDITPDGIPARMHHLTDILNWLDNSQSYPTGADAPGDYALGQNHPNPFNPVTTIDYSLKARGNVTLRVYNVAGQLVRTLVDQSTGAGSYRATWDGRDDAGMFVSSGVYFYKLISGDFARTKKMVLLK